MELEGEGRKLAAVFHFLPTEDELKKPLLQGEAIPRDKVYKGGSSLAVAEEVNSKRAFVGS